MYENDLQNVWGKEKKILKKEKNHSTNVII